MRTLTLAIVLSMACVAAADVRQTIVEAHGVDRFEQIVQIDFTFNVERDGELKASRVWSWRPHDQTVRRTVDGQTVSYSRADIAGDAVAVDRQWINDTFWLLPALHLQWASDDVIIADEGAAAMPIGEGNARRVVVTYPSDGGGYTPGDVYELFIDDAGLIRAWHFRRGGQAKPSLTNTFSDYLTAGPLKIAAEHRNADGSFRLYFTDVHVVTTSD
jgi:hypothetical protein